MKKILISLMMTLTISSCRVTGFSVSGIKEKQYLAKFLTYMDHTKGPMYNEMMNCISRKYLTTNKIDKGKYKVNNYTIWGYSIETYSTNGIITAKIWGENSWMGHLLTFQLTNENGKFYLEPSSHSDDYINPWSEAKTYINK